ncbi:MAG: hypothetical protein ACRETN_04925 [Nevskiales bacterium]
MPAVVTAPRGLGRDPRVTALALAVTWCLLLSCFIHDTAVGYFPVDDEWAWLANSSLELNRPLEWFRGTGHYFSDYPGIEPPAANFLRPVVNLVYALIQLMLGPFSAGGLYFNVLAISLGAGLTYWACAAIHPHADRRLALGLAALLPMLPAFGPSLTPLLMPSSGFDIVAAVFCLAAYMAYRRERQWLTIVFLSLAVLTKETALPAVAMFPLHYALERREGFFKNKQVMARAILLMFPILLWLALRLNAYGSLAGGVYAVSLSPGSVLRRIFAWPFFSDTLLPALQNTPAIRILDAPLRAINVLFAAGVLTVTAVRLLRGRVPGLAELCFLASYAFLLLTGFYARYGAVLDVFLLLTLAAWWAEHPRTRALGLGLLVFAVTICAYKSALVYPHLHASFQRLHTVARSYAELLHGFAEGEKVLVLNDPTTRHARLQWMETLIDSKADVVKAADFGWTALWLNPGAACEVGLAEVRDRPGRYLFRQSCGIELLGPHLISGSRPVEMKLSEWASVKLVPTRLPGVSATVWQEMTVELSAGPVRLVYFDPVGDRWNQRLVP